MSDETGMQDNDDRAYAPIADVAAAYGVSVDTIRRRIRKGELQGRKEQTPQGFRWVLPMPDPGETLPGHETGVAVPQPDHAAMVEVLQGELAARNAEIERLHALLDTQARALEAVATRPALPAPQEQAADDPQLDTETDTADHPVSIWGRIKRWYRL